MPTLIPDPLPIEVEQLLDRRRDRGADRHDEVWKGVLHMATAPSHTHARVVFEVALALAAAAKAAGLEVTTEINLGTGEQDYRVPDLAVHRPGAAQQWHPTAALCVEVLSPGDEAFHKLDFYAVHHVDKLLIVDPAARMVDWRALTEKAYEPVERSQLIELSAAELTAQIDWPA